MIYYKYLNKKADKNITTKKLFSVIFAVLMLMITITGCSGEENGQIVLTTGFAEDEVFKLEDEVCTLPEVLVYLTNTQTKYESVYGDEIWNITSNGVSMQDAVKDNVIADISQIKAMNILAKKNNCELSEEDMERVKETASDYYASLSRDEIEYMHVTEDVLVKMYSEYALSNKIYQQIIKDINPEISDDEARTITVQHILIKTYDTDEKGQKVELSLDEKNRAFENAKHILRMAKDGEHDFEELALQYSEGETTEISFGKGEMDPLFEQAAFNLGKDEISEIITTEYGYHILKCVTTFNKGETDGNKTRIADKQRQKVFGENYDEFASTLLTYLNEELWDSIKIVHNDNVTTQSFFETYDRYFNE